MSKKIAVVVTTYGEVEHLTLNELYHNSRRIINFITDQITSLSPSMKIAIALFRSIKRKVHWSMKGYKSNLCKITHDQVLCLQKAFNQHNNGFVEDAKVDVFEGYFFSKPYLEDTLARLDTYDHIIVLTMLPIESAFSCGVACKIAQEHLTQEKQSNVDLIGSLWNDDELIQIFLNHIHTSLLESSIAPDDPELGLILSVHGTLIADKEGKPYEIETGLDQTKAFYERVKKAIEQDSRFNVKSLKLGCINHHFGGQWTIESLEKAISELQSENVQHVALFPFGFFADNSEIDLEAKQKLLSAGFAKAQYINAVNSSDDFMNWIFKRLVRRINWYLNVEKAIEKFSIAYYSENQS